MLKTQFRSSPFKLIVGVYLFLVSLFALLFACPFAQKQPFELIDAIFLSSSALSATGLSTISISEQLSSAGYTLLMIEVQIGGIGIMATLGVFLFLFQGNISLSQQTLMSFDQNQKSLKSIKHLILFIFAFSLIVEAAGTLLIFPSLYPKYDSIWDAIFVSFFHSVSSFTGSGFDLFGNSLIGFSHDKSLLLTTAILILLGSFGFPTIIEVLFSKGKKKSLYTKVNVTVHLALMMIGFVLVLFFEYKHAFSSFSFGDKMVNSFFTSVSARNAGSTTVDNALLHSSTLMIIMLLMFIGGAPSSTGGGIRTTTFGVLWAKMVSVIKGESEVVLFKRSLHEEDVNKAYVITVFFFIIFFVSTLFLTFFEQKPLVDISYEVMSALTTTGLSTGITANLHFFSKLWLSIVMIIARIGIFSIIYLIIKPKKSNSRYIKEHIIVG